LNKKNFEIFEIIYNFIKIINIKKKNQIMGKKLILIFVSILLTTSVFSQRKGQYVNWLSMSVKGGYGVSALLNMDTYNDPNVAPKYTSGSYFFGGRFGITYGENVGTSFEVNYTNFSQEFTIKSGTEFINNKTQFTSLDLIGLLRFTSTTGFYAEIGPKFSNIKSVTETPSIEKSILDNAYKTRYNSAILGLGFMPLITDRVTLSVGLRVNYGITDIINDNTQYFAVTDDKRYTPDNIYTDSKTNVLQVHGVVELNYFFGYFGTANCGKHGIILFK